MANIAIGDITPKNQYTASANQTVFAYSFPIFAETDIKVYIGSTLKSLSTHYSVSGVQGANGGNVTLGTGASNGDIVTIYRDMAISRTSDYQANGDLLAETLNDDLDKIVLMAQQVEDQVNNNTLKVDQFDTSVDLTLPLVAARKGTVLGFHATTGAPEAGPTIANVNSLSAITANINTVAGIASNVTTVAGISANTSTVAGISSAVSTVAGISSAVSAVNSNASNINAVAADASDIGAVAGKATEIGRLGTSAAVADLAILGTSAIVADMAILGTSDVVADMNTLATSDVVADMNTLATSDVVTDMNLLATSTVVGNMNLLGTAAVVEDMGILATSAIVADLALLGTSDVVADMALLATSDVISDMNALATSDIISDLNTLATSDIVTDMNLLATSANVTAMGTLGTSANVTAMSTVSGAIANVNTTASNIAGVNSFADRWRVASSAPSSNLDEGDLYYNTNTNLVYFYNGSAWVQIANYSHPNHSGEVTSTADGATVIAGNVVDEANLKVSNAPSNGYYLQAQSGNTGGMTWAEVDALPSQSGNAGKFLTTNASSASWAVLDTDANSTTKGLYEMKNVISANYSIASGNNAMSAGPITINSNISVTVPSGSTWVIA